MGDRGLGIRISWGCCSSDKEPDLRSSRIAPPPVAASR
jgi:hypothetical protein